MHQGGNGKASANMKDDWDDIPMAYLLYIVLMIVVLVALSGSIVLCVRFRTFL